MTSISGNDKNYEKIVNFNNNTKDKIAVKESININCNTAVLTVNLNRNLQKSVHNPLKSKLNNNTHTFFNSGSENVIDQKC
jgi:hypothetical protein